MLIMPSTSSYKKFHPNELPEDIKLTYHKHMSGGRDGILSHFHNAPLYCITLWYLEAWRRMVRINKQLLELHIIYNGKWLIGSNNPPSKQIRKLLLIPRLLSIE
jgi:hypothetical protein